MKVSQGKKDKTESIQLLSSAKLILKQLITRAKVSDSRLFVNWYWQKNSNIQITILDSVYPLFFPSHPMISFPCSLIVLMWHTLAHTHTHTHTLACCEDSILSGSIVCWLVHSARACFSTLSNCTIVKVWWPWPRESRAYSPHVSCGMILKACVSLINTKKGHCCLFDYHKYSVKWFI